MRYLFPAYETNETLYDIALEFVKIVEEATEAFTAWSGEKDIRECAMEIMDTIHACETCLRMLDRRYPDLDLDSVRAYVIEKNVDRGYYG